MKEEEYSRMMAWVHALYAMCMALSIGFDMDADERPKKQVHNPCLSSSTTFQPDMRDGACVSRVERNIHAITQRRGGGMFHILNLQRVAINDITIYYAA